MDCGLLPAADRQLVDYDGWLRRRLDDLDGHHRLQVPHLGPRPRRPPRPPRPARDPVFNQLRSLGIPMRTGRISAFRAHAAQAPPPVIADALGFHQTTTHRQHVNADAGWSRYAGSRAAPR